MRLLILSLLTLGSAFGAGPISLGVKGGVPLTDAFQVGLTGNTGYVTDTKRYTVGPELDINLPFRFAIEFNALYKRLNYSNRGVDVFSSTSANSWEFPLLIKWRITGGAVRPYVAAGMNVHHLAGLKQVNQFFFGGNSQTTETNNAAELRNRNSVGGTFAGGLEVHLGLLKVAPEIRYTRWGADTFRSAVSGLLSFNPNQAEFLVGITF